MLLLAAVAGAVIRPARVPRFVPPLVCTVVALVSGLAPLGEARVAAESMETVVGFLLAAIPLSVLLDKTGYFEQVAEWLGAGRWLLPGLWALGAVTVAVLNLDAAVVLLTPLYLRIAERQSCSRVALGFQPVLLALLASSVLPVSNLTNLIVSARVGVSALQFAEHLGLPSLVASVAGYVLYRWCFSGALAAGDDAAGTPKPVQLDRKVLAGGSLVVAAVLAGFTAGPAVGLSAWEVALGADLVLVVATRRLPLRTIPWGTAIVATSLAVLATAATATLRLGSLFAGSGPLAMLREAGIAGAGANVVNNLPALLVALPYVGARAGHASCSLWPVLYGVNTGPGLVITGSLASLLWLDGMRRFGEHVDAAQYLRTGVRIVLPAAVLGLAVLLAMAPLVGC